LSHSNFQIEMKELELEKLFEEIPSNAVVSLNDSL